MMPNIGSTGFILNGAGFAAVSTKRLSKDRRMKDES